MPKNSERTVLIADDSLHHMAIVAEILRAHGFVKILTARTSDEAIHEFRFNKPDIMILDWNLKPVDGITLTKAIRRGDFQGPRMAPIIMLTQRATQGDVETARLAGVHEYAIKPVSSGVLMSRIEAVLVKPRRFVDSPVYVGPDRRRQNPANYAGPLRRLDDPTSEETKELVHATVARIGEVAKNFDKYNLEQVRAIYAAAEDIRAIAAETHDDSLDRAAASLNAYIKGMGNTENLEAVVVMTHVEALNQLIALPDVAIDARNAVAEGLEMVVRKKLRQARENAA